MSWRLQQDCLQLLKCASSTWDPVSDRAACSAAELGVQCPETDNLVLLFASNAMADSQQQHLKSLQQRQGLATAEVTGSSVVWAREEREDKTCKDMVSVLTNHQTQEQVATHEVNRVECFEAVTAPAVSSCSRGGAVPAALEPAGVWPLQCGQGHQGQAGCCSCYL